LMKVNSDQPDWKMTADAGRSRENRSYLRAMAQPVGCINWVRTLDLHISGHPFTLR
jgi:hypothetical protein